MSSKILQGILYVRCGISKLLLSQIVLGVAYQEALKQTYCSFCAASSVVVLPALVAECHT